MSVVVAALACFLFTGHGAADEVAPAEDTAFIRHRLEQLESQPDAAVAQGALEQARRALTIASSPGEETGASSRAREIARAALALADRQIGRRRAELQLMATQRRLTAIRERAKAQRLALETLMRERAALARGADP